MVIIYDFDGTLTPYSYPQYKILKDCGYDDEKLIKRIKKTIKETHETLYDAYFKVYKKILIENNKSYSYKNINYGADKVVFNKGVIEYFEDLNHKKTGITHIILTSGIKSYIENTKLKKYVDEIYGTTFKEKNGKIIGIEKKINDYEKVEIIKQILNKYNTNNIIYIGDGLTDLHAFKYVKSIGGKSILLTDKDNDKLYLDNKKIIDKVFKRDYRKGKALRNYIEKEIDTYRNKVE